MTDFERAIEFLESIGINYNTNESKTTIEIDNSGSNGKRFNSHKVCIFCFEPDGRFISIDIF